MAAGRRKWFVIVLSSTAVVAAAAYVGLGRLPLGRAQTAEPAAPAATKQVAEIPVTTAPVTLRPIERTVSIVGTLRGFEEIEVGTIVDGRIVRILHDVGDVVQPGEPLLEIDDTDYRLAVEEMNRALELELSRLGLKTLPDETFDVGTLPAVLRAKIVENNAAATLERYSKLVEKNAITTDDFEKAELNLRTAQLDVKQRLLEAEQTVASVRHRSAVLDTARKKLSDVRVVVPAASMMAGEPSGPINLVSTAPGAARPLALPTGSGTLTVAERYVSEGEIVRAAQASKLFRLVVEDPLKLEAAVPERFAGRIRVGQTVRLSVEAYPDRTFQGSVARVNPTVDEASRTFAIEVSIPNADRALKAGSFATALVSIGRDEQTPTVPEEAIVKFAGVTKVFLVDGGHVRAVPVELGTRLGVGADERAGHWVEARGLPTVGTVVTTGHSQLSDGSPVRVRGAEQEAATSTAGRTESVKGIR